MAAMNGAVAPAGGDAPGIGAATPFDLAKAALQPEIDRFGEGEVDRPTVMATATGVATRFKVGKIDLRSWAKLQLDALQTRVANTNAPTAAKSGSTPACATDPDPASNPLPVGKLIEAVATMAAMRVFCSADVATGVALWCVGTWGLYPPGNPDAGPDIFPRLHFHSPMKRCGKSTLLEVVQHTVRRPLAATDISEAAIFRSIDRWKPTLVIDEADRLFAKNRELVGIVNSGYARTDHVVRTAEVQVRGVRGFEPTTFATFGAVALAGIGALPATIEDRAVRVELQRQPHGQKLQRVGLRQLAALRDKLAPHLMAHADAIGAAMAAGVPDSALPPTLNDRDGDSWRPLLGLAALAGGDWPAKARRAAVALCAGDADGDRGPEWALRQVVEFVAESRGAAVAGYRAWVAGGRKTVKPLAGKPGAQRGAPCRFIGSDNLAGWLLQKDDSSFGECRDVGGVKLRVARLLRGFGVKPGRVHIAGVLTRGYSVPQIRAVWRRYRP